MSTKVKINKEIDRLAKKLVELVQIFRRGKPASDFKWWNSQSARSMFYPMYSYQDAKPIFEEVVQSMLGINSEMLSQHEIETKTMYEFLQMQTISYTKHFNGQNLLDEAKEFLNKLAEFEAWQDVDIPVANLWLEGEPSKLGEVTFMKVTEEELEQWQKQGLWSELVLEVHVIARVRAPGDQQKALSYARSHVNLALDVLRAFCFPFGRNSDTWRVGVVGDIISSASTPMRINNRQFVTLLGSGIAQNELKKHILAKLEQRQWELIDKLFRKTHPSKMERKLRDSIHWLAESTKPDMNNSKFAKISFALETLLGGEPKDEELKVRGITAMLSERAAFIAGRGSDDRQTIDKDIRKYYGMRSNIVHGGEGDVSLDDVDNFGHLVRRLALAMLDKLDRLGDKIGDVDKLENWVKMQRYRLPEDTTKEDS